MEWFISMNQHITSSFLYEVSDSFYGHQFIDTSVMHEGLIYCCSAGEKEESHIHSKREEKGFTR